MSKAKRLAFHCTAQYHFEKGKKKTPMVKNKFVSVVIRKKGVFVNGIKIAEAHFAITNVRMIPENSSDQFWLDGGLEKVKKLTPKKFTEFLLNFKNSKGNRVVKVTGTGR